LAGREALLEGRGKTGLKGLSPRRKLEEFSGEEEIERKTEHGRERPEKRKGKT